MLAPSTTGANCPRTSRISALFAEHALRGMGTHIASGQSLRARAIGIAERTPNFRVSYDAEQTTPRLSRDPPTIRRRALPAPRGSTMRATATKNASASARRTRRADGIGRLRDALRLESPLDDFAANETHVVALRTGPSGDHSLDLVVLEIDPGVVVAGVAGLQFTGSDHPVIGRPALRFTVVVRRVAALQESEALDHREHFGPRIR